MLRKGLNQTEEHIIKAEFKRTYFSPRPEININNHIKSASPNNYERTKLLFSKINSNRKSIKRSKSSLKLSPEDIEFLSKSIFKEKVFNKPRAYQANRNKSMKQKRETFIPITQRIDKARYQQKLEDTKNIVDDLFPSF